MEKMSLVMVVKNVCGEKRAVAVQHWDFDNVMDVVCDYIDDKEYIVSMYQVKDEVIAEKVASTFNQNTDKAMSQIIEDTIVHQRLEYVREDTEEDNMKLSKLSSDTLTILEKETESIDEKLMWYKNLIESLIGDGAYTWDMTQIKHHFGQMRIDLFDVFSENVVDE